jgi:hypothetical protein
MGMGDRAFASATELSNEIRDRHIGCVELLDFYLARAERYNPALNAIPEIIGQNSGIKQIPNPAATSSGSSPPARCGSRPGPRIHPRGSARSSGPDIHN